MQILKAQQIRSKNSFQKLFLDNELSFVAIARDIKQISPVKFR
ncbi:hypothetical protein [Okeania sp. SIO2B3]|nr:hypothetical protein [Okeania sp. SIO2B3]